MPLRCIGQTRSGCRQTLRRRRRRHGSRHDRRPTRLHLLAGFHRPRRLARRSLRREDLQGHGSRGQDRLSDDRHQRLRRRADPRRRRQPWRLCRDLLAQRASIGSHPADLDHRRTLRWRRRLQPGYDRLHHHGGSDLADVHHGTGDHQDGDRRRSDRSSSLAVRRRTTRRAVSPTSSRRTRTTRSSRPASCWRFCRRTTSTICRSSRAMMTRSASTPRSSTSSRRPRTSPTTCTRSSRVSSTTENFFEVQALYGGSLLVGFARFGRPPDRHRRQSAESARRRAGYRFVHQGRALRALLRRVQHPARDVRRRAGFLARHLLRSTAASSSTARSCSTPLPKRRCRSSPSSRARRTAARTTSCAASTSAPTSTSRGRPPRSRSWARKAR